MSSIIINFLQLFSKQDVIFEVFRHLWAIIIAVGVYAHKHVKTSNVIDIILI